MPSPLRSTPRLSSVCWISSGLTAAAVGVVKSLSALLSQDASDWLIDVQEALVQQALVQEADVHEALVQEASAFAALVQLAASKTGSVPPAGSATRKRLSARFGLGGFVSAAALAASTSPTPSDQLGAAVGFAVSISAPLTWSGVQFGCSASSTAAAPETTGAANEVPDSSM